jgi:oligopeptide/dipeptide ABC transporter ATP-binding protein
MTTSSQPAAAAPGPSADEPLVEVRNLSIHFPVGRVGFWGRQRRVVHAVDDVSFTIRKGETLGLVGESGSGKTTTGRAILRRIDPTAGTIHFRGRDITGVKGEELRRLRRHMQLVFQDPYASLNPRMKVHEIVAEPLVVHGIVPSFDDARDQVLHLLELCGLPRDAADRYPHAFSGGQRQRVGIARALALEPELIVADEPVSALDVSIRAQVVNLLQDLQDELGLTYLFIAHDLSVVRHISHRIAIMYAGKLVELADCDDVYEHTTHPYTEALLSSVPIPDPPTQRARRRIVLQGEIPDPVDPPPGCRFASRCPIAVPRCSEVPPIFTEIAAGHRVACDVRTGAAETGGA